jgi:hypothetical protein
MSKFYDVTLRIRVRAKGDDNAYNKGIEVEEFARTVEGFEDSMIDYVDEVEKNDD